MEGPEDDDADQPPGTRRAKNGGGAAVPQGVRRIGLPVEQLPDEVLLGGFGTGDPELEVAFVRRFQSKAYGIALAVLGDRTAAEDVAQAAFERAWRHARTYDPLRGSVGTWLGAITRNLAIDALRVRVPVPLDASELLARMMTGGDHGTSPTDAVVARDGAASLRIALRQLPIEQARAVALAGIVGLSASQVATAEGIPLGTAKTRIRTAMQRLRVSLTESGVGNG